MTKTAMVYTQLVRIKLPTETVVIGPGTVPTSSASISSTSVEGMASGLRKASKAGLFDTFIKDDTPAGSSR